MLDFGVARGVRFVICASPFSPSVDHAQRSLRGQPADKFTLLKHARRGGPYSRTGRFLTDSGLLYDHVRLDELSNGLSFDLWR